MARKHKGPRDMMVTRVPVEVGQILRARAIRADVSYGELIAAILSEYVGLSHQCPMPNIDHTGPFDMDLPTDTLPFPVDNLEQMRPARIVA